MAPSSGHLRPPPGIPGPRSVAASPAARPRVPARSSLRHPGQSRPGLELHRPKERGAECRKRKWVVGRDRAEGRSGFFRERRRADGEIRERSRGLRTDGGVWRPRAAAAASGETALGAVAQAAQVGCHRPEICARASPPARPSALPYPAVGAREGVSGVTLATSRVPSLPSWTRSERWPTLGLSERLSPQRRARTRCRDSLRRHHSSQGGLQSFFFQAHLRFV